MQSTTKGYIAGIAAAVSYGLNPLFAVPLFRQGVDTGSMLLYRYGLAAIILAAIMWSAGRSFRLGRRQVWPMAGLSVMFALSSLTLFESYRYIDVGIASTMLFVYPVMVALINRFIYSERMSAATVGAIFLAMGGLLLLYLGGGEAGARLDTTGVMLVMGSAASYAVYLVGVNRTSVRTLSSTTLTFYSIAMGTAVYAAALAAGGGLTLPADASGWGCAAGLAVFPTIISILTINIAIHFIGSTPTAILGALEPATGVAVGILMFGEHLTPASGAGILLVLGAVLLLILARRK